MNKQNAHEINGEEPVVVGSSRLVNHTTQLFQHHIPTAFVVLAILELGMLMLAFYAGVEARFFGVNAEGKALVGPLAPKAFLFSVVMWSSLVAMGAYKRGATQSFSDMIMRIGSGIILGMLPLALAYYFAPMFFLGRGALALAVAFGFVLVIGTRLAFDKIADHHTFQPRVLVLGTGSNAHQIRAARDNDELGGLNIVGFVQLNPEETRGERKDVIASQERLIDIASNADIDQIVLAVDDRRNALPVQEILDCKMSGISVVDLLTFFERETGKIRLDILQPSWLFLSDGFHLNALRRISKRVFDLGFALVMLPFVLPIMALVAIASSIESGFRGPIFYRQVRVGKNGKHFEIIKFRSMRVDAESNGPQWAAANDNRITRLGSFIRRTRLDELPQLFNILKGDMSFVGPRPERPEFTRQLRNNIPYYGERHRVKPGLTGWAQIRYPYGATEADALQKLQYDLFYVKNYSIFLDLLILLQTAEVVLLRKGAH